MSMNQADKEAFEKDWKSKNDEFNFHGAIHEGKWYYVSIIEQRAFDQWNAALTHARSGEEVGIALNQIAERYLCGEPVYQAILKENLPHGTKLFTHRQVAEQPVDSTAWDMNAYLVKERLKQIEQSEIQAELAKEALVCFEAMLKHMPKKKHNEQPCEVVIIPDGIVHTSAAQDVLEEWFQELGLDLDIEDSKRLFDKLSAAPSPAVAEPARKSIDAQGLDGLRKLFIELTNSHEVCESGEVVGHVILNEQLDRLEILLAQQPTASDVRDEAIEDAAMICDGIFQLRAKDGFAREASAARTCADKIRALKSKSAVQAGKL